MCPWAYIKGDLHGTHVSIETREYDLPGSSMEEHSGENEISHHVSIKKREVVFVSFPFWNRVLDFNIEPHIARNRLEQLVYLYVHMTDSASVIHPLYIYIYI